MESVLPVFDFTLSFFRSTASAPLTETIRVLQPSEFLKATKLIRPISQTMWYINIVNPEFNSFFIREWTNIFVNYPSGKPLKNYAFMFTSTMTPICLLLYHYKPYTFSVNWIRDIHTFSRSLVENIKDNSYNQIVQCLIYQPERPELDLNDVEQTCIKELSYDFRCFMQNDYILEDGLNLDLGTLQADPGSMYLASDQWSTGFVHFNLKKLKLNWGDNLEPHYLKWRNFHHEFNYLRISDKTRYMLNTEYTDLALQCIDFYDKNLQNLF